MSPKDPEAQITSLKGMYEDYFLDYASYVILERAVPAIEDGLKPVQRRILHSMREMDDGRFHKVANIIGHTMQYHPHGDAAIGDALVNLGQKELLIETQGNWGDIRTGDSAAAPRYIEARLTKFALEVLFNPQTTEWQLSYDGRRKEPINLPVKFPLILAQGVDGIAVGLSTKILPHNFIELIKASIDVLKGKKVILYPDFQTGGQIDVEQYGGGKRGGKVRVRSKIEIQDKKNLVVKELPYGVTTTQLIDSILKANDKGKIKIKKVIDNTAKDVEVLIELVPGTSPDVTIGALYAFTDCEVSISPNACVIIDNKPHFLTVEEMLHISTENTKELLRRELEIKKGELEEKWHLASLEKIFIENRIYRDIEECESFEEVIETIDEALKKYIVTPSMKATPNDKRLRLVRDVTQEDIIRLTEIKIKRISKYNTFKADEVIRQIEEDLEQTLFHLAHLTEYAIDYFKSLLEKYGAGRERRTEITSFDSIQATQVIANNAKLYVNHKEGFIGYGMKNDEFVTDCSDIDDIIVIRKDGNFQVSRIADKVFVGKDILHVAVWQKGDDRTTYNLVYLDGKSGRSMVKRFQVTAITRDKPYDLTKGTPGSKVLYLTANPNGESEVINVQLSSGCKAKIKNFEFDFATLDIKGRTSQGNILTKYPVRKITQMEVGKSTLGAQKLWMDEVSGNLNKDERGLYLGAFDTGDQILVITRDGSYQLTDFELTNRYVPKDIVHIGKFDHDEVISAVYYDGDKDTTFVKRFQIETSSANQKFGFISEHRSSQLYFASTDPEPTVIFTYKEKNKKMQETILLHEFIDVKGWKAQGNKLISGKLVEVKQLEGEDEDGEEGEPGGALKTGDTIEFDVPHQKSIFDLDDEQDN
ncbi:MAG TPA: DNA gyrase/topoisomerase IV subunit A [Saprospiraceae bacterium]|nr:DNA gyrase/topoisomerase IV subunit A [Saprospiraceae bacterium]